MYSQHHTIYLFSQVLCSFFQSNLVVILQLFLNFTIFLKWFCVVFAFEKSPGNIKNCFNRFLTETDAFSVVWKCREHHPLLVAYHLDAVTRRDDVKTFSYDEFQKVCQSRRSVLAADLFLLPQRVCILCESCSTSGSPYQSFGSLALGGKFLIIRTNCMAAAQRKFDHPCGPIPARGCFQAVEIPQVWGVILALISSYDRNG